MAGRLAERCQAAPLPAIGPADRLGQLHHRLEAASDGTPPAADTGPHRGPPTGRSLAAPSAAAQQKGLPLRKGRSNDTEAQGGAGGRQARG